MFRTKILRELTTTILGVSFLLGSVQAQTPASRISESAEFKKYEGRWLDAMKSFDVAGFSVAIVKDGEINVLDSFGCRDPVGEKPVTPDSIFYIASVTKTFVATTILTLAEKGLVDLDAPVVSYLPRLELEDSALTKTISVRDLLTHRYGIESEMIVFLDAYTGQITDDRYYHWLKKANVHGSVKYSNVHFTLLGRIIESVTGEKWQDYLENELLQPLGLDRTTAYASEMYGDRDCAFPSERIDGQWLHCQVRKNDSVMHAAGGMGTTARDAARFLQFNINSGQLDGKTYLDSKSIADMQTLHTQFDLPNGSIRVFDGFGLAWNHGSFRGHKPYLQHGGGYTGSAAHVSFLPEQRIGVVVLANSSPGGQALMNIVSIDIYDQLLGESGHDDLLVNYKERFKSFSERLNGQGPTEPIHTDESLESYVGKFESEMDGTLEVSIKEGKLIGTLGILKLQLEPDDSEQFSVDIGPFHDMVCNVTRNDESQVVRLQFESDSLSLSFDRR